MITLTFLFRFFLLSRIFWKEKIQFLVEFNFQHFNVRTQLNAVTSAVTGGEK